MRITCSCPEDLVSDGNQLAMALGFSEADGQTYRGLNWTDGTNIYAAASFDASDAWLEAAQAPLTRPAWDTGTERTMYNELGEPDGTYIVYIIDMDAAARAQAALVFWQATEDSPTPPAADPTKLTAIGGMEGPDAIAAMGLAPADEETAGI